MPFEALKHPDEVRDFVINWADEIGVATITASAWAVVEGGLVVDSNSFTATTSRCRCSAGDSGVWGRLQNDVTLSSGAVLVRVIKLHMDQDGAT